MSQLNNEQLAQFKGKLDVEQAQIRSTIDVVFRASDHASHQIAAKNLGRLPLDELIEFTQEIENPELAKNVRKLKNIEASLISIELGMYGLCSDCESDLLTAQLEEKPTMQRCTYCESKYQKQKRNNYRL